MLLTEKLLNTKLSYSEKIIVNYILKQKYNIKNKTIKEMSKDTFVNPSIFIRISKKLGYTGWNELKELFLKEITYLDSNFENIDANIPFDKNDSYISISNKLGKLSQITIKDTLSLLHNDDLENAVEILNSASDIKLFANNESILISQDFALKMNRIKKYVSICTVDGEQVFEAFNCRKNSCAIIISYSGETKRLLKTIPILKKSNIPILAITSLGNNTLANNADCVLHITTRERLYSKISSFTSNNSIYFILDILYSCIFSKNYEENLTHKIKVSKLVDPRTSKVEIIKEN
ncbi:MurR/RpiR family transcriptional regulator [Clostridium sporogenes]|uniref:MurR/RpiR family transcriptional regulator n=1 Tax=unclassified Clostridium TaxID=2614128 RepID=UPI0013D2A11D|nr:MurR/RpiR family transcriptional regulator [Clostridium sporogenes]NFS26444.1 MurR/RpiR family transcriptional regulator [Clostridium sporogenes]